MACRTIVTFHLHNAKQDEIICVLLKDDDVDEFRQARKSKGRQVVSRKCKRDKEPGGERAVTEIYNEPGLHSGIINALTVLNFYLTKI